MRQYVFIYPYYFVICDRVTSTDASYRKEWLLHTQNEPVVDGTMFRADPEGGRLFCRTMYPIDANLSKVGDEYLTNIVVAGCSPFEVDTVGTYIMGHDPREVWYTRVAQEKGYGECDPAKIDIYRIRPNGDIEPVKDLSEIKRRLCPFSSFFISSLFLKRSLFMCE